MDGVTDDSSSDAQLVTDAQSISGCNATAAVDRALSRAHARSVVR
jgi:hypothetical protein